MDIKITGFEKRTTPDGKAVSIYTAEITDGEHETGLSLTQTPIMRDDVLGVWFDANTGEEIRQEGVNIDMALAGWRARTAVPADPTE